MPATARKTELDEIEVPWGPQMGFLRSAALFRRYQGGQGSGKTVSGCFAVRQFAKEHAKSITICTEPTYPMIRDILKPEFDRQFAAATTVQDVAEIDVVRYVKSEHKYILPHGSEIWLRQCDKSDALRGPSVAAVWMDEAAQSPHSAFQILVGRMRQRGYPHMFLCTGTPRGRNWLHWVFTAGQRPGYAPQFIGDALEELLDDLTLQELRGEGEEDAPLVDSFFASALDNPYLDPVARAALQGTYTPGTARYRQEVKGETTVFEGLVYPNFNELMHVAEPPPKREFVTVIGAQDWGYSNPGCLLVLGLRENGQVWVLDERHEERMQVAPDDDEDTWTDTAVALSEEWGIERVVCDPSQPEFIAYYRKAGLDAVGANNEVTPGITEVDGLINRDKLRVAPGCLATLGEFAAYSWKTKGRGTDELQTDRPEPVDDHAMDALRYGCMELRGGPPQPRRMAISTAQVGGGRRRRR